MKIIGRRSEGGAVIAVSGFELYILKRAMEIAKGLPAFSGYQKNLTKAMLRNMSWSNFEIKPILTEHAVRRMQEREIDADEVLECLQKGFEFKRNQFIHNGVISVVGDSGLVITVYRDMVSSLIGVK